MPVVSTATLPPIAHAKVGEKLGTGSENETENGNGNGNVNGNGNGNIHGNGNGTEIETKIEPKIETEIETEIDTNLKGKSKERKIPKGPVLFHAQLLLLASTLILVFLLFKRSRDPVYSPVRRDSQDD